MGNINSFVINIERSAVDEYERERKIKINQRKW